MKGPGRFEGMIQVVRFNPWFYVGSTLLLLLGAILLFVSRPALPSWMMWLALAGWALAAWWLAASLAVSWWIYDLSDWPRGLWIRRALGETSPKRALNVHSGFDETTERLRSWLPGTAIETLDVFDPAIHTERSLHRARAWRRACAGTIHGPHHAWPVEHGTYDAVFLLLTAHEFRTPDARRALLVEALKALRQHDDNAVVILAEHARDFANFLPFGPGFGHFHSEATWRADWEAAGLHAAGEFRVTPFLRVWTLRAKDAA